MADVPHNLRVSPGIGTAYPDGGESLIEIAEDAATAPVGDEAVVVEFDDGSITIDLAPPEREMDEKAKDHDANLALYIADAELNRIAEEIVTGYEADEQGRSEWLETRKNGLTLLGLKLEQPKGDIGGSSAPLEGMSTVRHPLLLEAVLRFQANARGELLPSNGPVKVRNDSTLGLLKSTTGIATVQGKNLDTLGEALEKDLNHYLTVTAPEYYPDTDRMLFYVGFGGCGFKKIYHCPLRRRPVSESVDAKDLVVSNAATDLKNSPRVTHVIPMRPSVLKRMQMVGAYRKVPLSSPSQGDPVNPVTEKVAEIQGVTAQPQRPEDQDYEILECYTELNIRGFEHEEDGEPTGLAIPYKVTLEKQTRQVLEVRRNWAESDDLFLPKTVFVKYPFVPGLGFYDLGLVHILGNSTAALTTAWRLMLDAGMFANFPGFVYLKGASRQQQNEFRIPPAGGMPLESDVADIRAAIMPLPYKDVGGGLMSLTENIAQTAQRVGGTAETNIGEGKQDAPVGTTMALIEQATKIMDAVHKRIHAAQAEEFQILKQLFREDPDALWRGRRTTSVSQVLQENSSATEANEEALRAQFIKALDENDLVPVADPNTPSHIHRLMKAMAIKQLQGASPQLYDAKKVDERILEMIGVDDADSLFAPPMPPMAPPPNPQLIAANAKMMDAQTKQAEAAIKAATAQAGAQGDSAANALKQQEIQSKERIAVLDLAKTIAVHPLSEGVVDETIAQHSAPQGGIQ